MILRIGGLIGLKCYYGIIVFLHPELYASIPMTNHLQTQYHHAMQELGIPSLLLLSDLDLGSTSEITKSDKLPYSRRPYFIITSSFIFDYSFGFSFGY